MALHALSVLGRHESTLQISRERSRRALRSCEHPATISACALSTLLSRHVCDATSINMGTGRRVKVEIASTC